MTMLTVISLVAMSGLVSSPTCPIGVSSGLMHSTLAAAQADDRKDGTERSNATAAAISRARKAIKAEDYALAGRLIDSGLKSGRKADKDQWQIVSAQLHYAKKEYARAGLEAMHVVILRPVSEEYGEALYWTARAYEKLGRPEKASELYAECIKHPTTGESVSRNAKARMESIEGKSD